MISECRYKVFLQLCTGEIYKHLSWHKGRNQVSKNWQHFFFFLMIRMLIVYAVTGWKECSDQIFTVIIYSLLSLKTCMKGIRNSVSAILRINQIPLNQNSNLLTLPFGFMTRSLKNTALDKALYRIFPF